MQERQTEPNKGGVIVHCIVYYRGGGGCTRFFFVRVNLNVTLFCNPKLASACNPKFAVGNLAPTCGDRAFGKAARLALLHYSPLVGCCVNFSKPSGNRAFPGGSAHF